MNIDRLNVFRKGLKVERLHTVTHIAPYNNGFHSANAALIANELCYENCVDSKYVIISMLLHDVAEGYTGDIPANVKRDNPKFSKALKDIETTWEKTNIFFSAPYHLTPQQKDICKIANIVELGMYSLDELNMGNKNLKFVLKNVVDSLEEFRKYKGVIPILIHFNRYN
jgi:5'-deoxynucleotidase YfbR-like HD superfamily hydrolase